MIDHGRFLPLLIFSSGILFAAEPRFPAPPAKYQVSIKDNVRVPMRDGVLLATDLYLPVGPEGKLPAVMIRTPYNRKSQEAAARMFAGQGYAVAVQDVRGKFGSDGEFTVSANDTRDGSDLLDWIAQQPWATGKIGTYGCSYVGEDQIELAKVRNPRQTAMIAQAAGGAYHFAGLITGGALEMAMASEWFHNNGNKLDPHAKAPPLADNFAMWNTLPLLDMVRKSGASNTDWEDWVSHDLGDPWWQKFGYVNDSNRFNTPGLHVVSWNDNVVKHAIDLFNLLGKNSETAAARANQFLIVSPTTHCGSERATEHTQVGALDLGDAQLDYYRIYVKWFDHFLKGEENGVTKMPKVQIYVMGKNEWRGENEWPLARTQFTRFYLGAKGALALKPAPAGPPDTYTYDPGNPVPTVGGDICCSPRPDVGDGPRDQREVESRQDVLVYSTPPLEQGVEITGPVEARLFVSSEAKDTDFTAKLVDVYPDGRAFNIREGIQRMRYREGDEKQVWMKPGDVYEITVGLMATSIYLPAGHRIRLEVSSSNFPRFDRNMNTGGKNYDETKWVVARNQVYRSGARSSYLLLPVIPPAR
jgi:putative CocE/NonD family hydrolase